MADMEVLDGPRRYYAEVMKPAYDEFFELPSSFRTAFNLASSLFHFHEWLYEYSRAKLEAHFGKPLNTPGEARSDKTWLLPLDPRREGRVNSIEQRRAAVV